MAQEPGSRDSSTTPGSRIAGYEIGRLIGRGGMSEVYAAVQTGTGRPIALKLLGGRRADDPRFVERLRREGFALARIRHPNVVVVYDAGVAEGQAWIAMDLLEGASMRDLLVERGRLPLPQALAYAGAIFDGLEAAHRLGIIHRDMKPENVFLTHDGGLKVVDFGNAKLLNSGLKSTDPHKVFGTAAYMSPEQLGFRRSVSARSDLYSVGLMLYEMLLGRHAFSDGPDPYDLPPSLELCRLQIEETPARLAKVEPKIPQFVSEFVARLVDKNPDRRPDSAFLAAREVRDMHDYILREARGAGISPAPVALTPPQTPRSGAPRPEVRRSGAAFEPPAVPDPSLTPERAKPPRERSPAPSGFGHSTAAAMVVGAVLGAAVFGIFFFARDWGPSDAAASGGPLGQGSPSGPPPPLARPDLPRATVAAAAPTPPLAPESPAASASSGNADAPPAAVHPLQAPPGQAYVAPQTAALSRSDPWPAPEASGQTSRGEQTFPRERLPSAGLVRAEPSAPPLASQSTRKAVPPKPLPARDPYAPIF